MSLWWVQPFVPSKGPADKQERQLPLGRALLCLGSRVCSVTGLVCSLPGHGPVFMALLAAVCWHHSGLQWAYAQQ